MIFAVAPYAGAWIEIYSGTFTKLSGNVAPYAGAWIEIIYLLSALNVDSVAPYAGAWIEMRPRQRTEYPPGCRSLCGSVD